MEIPDSVWLRMQGKTYVENPHITRSDLRYLRVLHWDYDNKTHRGELVCNRLIADKLIAIFRELYQARYPIERIRLADDYNADDERQMSDNNTSCFCYRNVPDTKKLSYHARGLAIDINPRYNPYVRFRNGAQVVQPANGRPYADRSRQFRYKIKAGDLTSSSNHNKNKERRDIPSSLRPTVHAREALFLPPSSFLLPRSRLKPSLKAQPPGSGAKVQSPATLLWGLT